VENQLRSEQCSLDGAREADPDYPTRGWSPCTQHDRCIILALSGTLRLFTVLEHDLGECIVDFFMKSFITPRLEFIPLEPAHADVLFAGLRDPALYEFIDDGPPKSVEEVRRRYQRLSTRLSPDQTEKWLNWAILSRQQCKYLGFLQATVRSGKTAEIAYLLFREFWGQGFASESVAAVIPHQHHNYGVTNIVANVDPRNCRSIALLLALGFVLTESRCGSARLHGTAADESRYERQIVLETGK
jgi:[ribosomal protein S5]-alanine N-acetyltransferase